MLLLLSTLAFAETSPRFAVSGNNVLLVHMGHVFLSTKRGENWLDVTRNLNNPVEAILARDEEWFAATRFHIYVSRDYGETWTAWTRTETQHNSLVLADQRICHFRETVRCSADGATWTTHGAPPEPMEDGRLIAGGGGWWAARSNMDPFGMWISADDGKTWEHVEGDAASEASGIVRLMRQPPGAEPGAFYRVERSTDGGQTWTDLGGRHHDPMSQIELDGDAVTVIGQESLTRKRFADAEWQGAAYPIEHDGMGTLADRTLVYAKEGVLIATNQTYQRRDYRVVQLPIPFNARPLGLVNGGSVRVPGDWWVGKAARGFADLEAPTGEIDADLVAKCAHDSAVVWEGDPKPPPGYGPFRFLDRAYVTCASTLVGVVQVAFETSLPPAEHYLPFLEDLLADAGGPGSPEEAARKEEEAYWAEQDARAEAAAKAKTSARIPKVASADVETTTDDPGATSLSAFGRAPYDGGSNAPAAFGVHLRGSAFVKDSPLHLGLDLALGAGGGMLYELGLRIGPGGYVTDRLALGVFTGLGLEGTTGQVPFALRSPAGVTAFYTPSDRFAVLFSARQYWAYATKPERGKLERGFGLDDGAFGLALWFGDGAQKWTIGVERWHQMNGSANVYSIGRGKLTLPVAD